MEIATSARNRAIMFVEASTARGATVAYLREGAVTSEDRTDDLFRGTTRFVVLYDGVCGLCQWTVRWLVAHDRDRILNPVPLQTRGVLERFGISRAAALRELHVVGRDGERLAGADAVLWVTSALPGYGWLGLVLRVPPLRWLARIVYREIARRRIRHECANGSCQL